MTKAKEEDLGNIRIRYDYLEDKGILWMEVSGWYSPGFLRGAMGRGLAEMQELECVKCLVDLRNATHKMSILETSCRPYLAEEAGIPHSYSIAFLLSDLAEELKFGEMVFGNEGWNFRVFSSFAD